MKHTRFTVNFNKNYVSLDACYFYCWSHLYIMRFLMRVAAGERAVCEISQQKYYYRHRYDGQSPIRKPLPPFYPHRLVIAVPFQLYA